MNITKYDKPYRDINSLEHTCLNTPEQAFPLFSFVFYKRDFMFLLYHKINTFNN